MHWERYVLEEDPDGELYAMAHESRQGLAKPILEFNWPRSGPGWHRIEHFWSGCAQLFPYWLLESPAIEEFAFSLSPVRLRDLPGYTALTLAVWA